MSIVGRYSLDLYCDCQKCKKARENGDFGENVPTTFNAWDRGLAYTEARKAGWVININLPACWKPGHKEAE